MISERYDREVVLYHNDSKYSVLQTWGKFGGYPMGSLYYYCNEKLFLTATITKPLSKEELTEYLNDILKKE